MNEYLQKLYDDERLTDELQDEVAQTLLAWAQAEYTRLMETHTDKTQLETQLKRVRRAMRAVNRLMRDRLAGDEKALQKKITRFVDILSEIGHMIPEEAVTTLREQQAELEPITLVQRLTTLHLPQGGASTDTIDAPEESGL